MTPKPPVALVISSVLVVAGCLVLVSFSLAMMLAVTWDLCSSIGGGILLPIPSFLAYRQYRAMAWSDSRAGQESAILLFLIGGFAIAMFAVNLSEMTAAKARIPRLSMLLPILGVGVYAILAAWVDLRWSRRLKRAASTSVATAPVAHFTRRDALAGLSAVVSVSVSVFYIVKSTPPQYAEHGSRDDAPLGLPAGARDVSYCQGPRLAIAAEFTVEENQFTEWIDSGIGSEEANAAAVSPKPISEAFTITRFYALTKNLEGPDSITIRNGLFYDWRREDRGVCAAFDRSTGRAYYYTHFH